ncbi:hypothetical protein ABMA70_08000 [Halobacteriovorax sp. XZX-3]|uniref:hypothetical protein n=1 Tax=unclassified Halobacteriovorax TaxID=2639665 RepID=UPI000CD04019|nr:hypothetical protein [Halobacteriovorax sp. DA5]POB12753.1 hypothetical protein C0Z22_12785 [Halobacteriovorax sp. DA5]
MKFVLYNCTQEERINWISVFKERYHFPDEYISDFLVTNSVYDIFKLKPKRCMILDIHTLKLLGETIPCDLVVFSNEGHEMRRYGMKKVKYYGFYEYQNFDEQELLKFSFGNYKDLNTVDNYVFVNTPSLDYTNVVIPELYRDRKLIYKIANKHHENLHEKFDTMLYYQSGKVDTNNRLVPESLYYKKKVEIFKSVIQDSVNMRYNDILLNGFEAYHLTDEDKLIQDFLD